MAQKHGLGRGLGALIKDDGPSAKAEQREQNVPLKIHVTSISPNQNQPRTVFDDSALADLSASIRQHGVLQPLIVRPDGNGGYELISGERRLRAATAAGVTQVPVIVIDAPDVKSLEIALVENLQRENLNVLEEAEGYHHLAEKFSLTQEQIAERVGKARASVANALRLLTLPDEIKKLIGQDIISAGHAKLIVGIEIPEEQLLYARRIVKEKLSVRKLESILQQAKKAPRRPRVTRDDIPGGYLAHLSNKMHTHFGTNVRISPSRTYANGKKAKGTIELDFYSNEDLTRILEILGVSAD